MLENKHQDESHSEASDSQSGTNVPDTSKKKDGVTSSFSATTGDPGKYSGEDISDVQGDTGSDQDKTAE